MFKFGKPYNVQEIYSWVETGNMNTGMSGRTMTYDSGLTMNYMVSIDPAFREDFTPRQNIVSRYATKIANPNYYGIISHSIRWEDEI